MSNIETVDKLIESFRKLPGIGKRTAERLAYATLNLTKEDREDFIKAIDDSINKVKRCPDCGYFFEDECPICSDKSRDHKCMIVVSNSKDITSIEKTKSFNGVYFTLNGTISPLRNKDHRSVGIDRLVERIEKDNVAEIILALPTDLEGETTALYITSLLKEKNVRVSRLAYGIPIGTNLEYLDDMTISQSIKFRVDLKEDKKNG